MESKHLSKNFTLAELAITGINLPNTPTEVEIANLQTLVTNVLQPVRDMIGGPVKVNSGYRSPAVNRAISGATNSQHCKGEAADLDTTDNARLFYLLRDKLPFDQLIWEAGNDAQPDWVHVSYREGHNRKQVLKMKVVGGKKKYEVI